MRHALCRGLVFTAAALLTLAAPVAAQQSPPPQKQPEKPQAQAPAQAGAAAPAAALLSEEKMSAYVSAFDEVARARENFSTQVAMRANKIPEMQAELRDKLKEQIKKILEEKGISEAEYAQITWNVSVDPKFAELYNEIRKRTQGAAPPK